MVFKRRMRLLVLGFLGSICACVLLIISCLRITTLPVVATVTMSFPATLEGTSLTVMGITGYEGPYVEDGSDEEVADIAAICVLNTGVNTVERAMITLIGERGDMRFALTCLPPGETAIVLEQDQKLWTGAQFTHWLADCTESQPRNMQLKVNVSPEGCLEISNPTNNPIENVTIMHKTWSESFCAYLGGISYETRVQVLKPGQLMLIHPEHFAPGISKIVAVTADGQ